MSIDVYKKDQQEFLLEEPLQFNLVASGSPQFIDVTATEIKPQQETKMMSPKEQRLAKHGNKHFWQLLEESWFEGIRNRGHTDETMSDGDRCYYCPLLCVAEYLGINDQSSNHIELRDEIYKWPKINGNKDTMYGCPEEGCCCSDRSLDEVMIAFHIAWVHEWTNYEVSQYLKGIV